MVIRNRDGSVYRLRGPNPVMETQSFWDMGQVEFINFHVDENYVMTDTNSPRKRVQEVFKARNIAEELGLNEIEKQMAQAVKPDEFLSELKAPIEPTPPAKLAPEEPLPMKLLREKGVDFLCVPVKDVVVRDELYGVNYKRRTYGEKLSFKGVVVGQNDLQIRLWAKEDIKEESIIYRAERGGRWWRINGRKEADGGYLLAGIPSDVNPDFS